jgi:hypothetical protein
LPPGRIGIVFMADIENCLDIKDRSGGPDHND